MLLPGPDDILPVWRNPQILTLFLVAADIAEQTWLAIVHIRGPCLLLRYFCLALWVWRGAFFVDLAAARAHDRVPFRRQPPAHDRLPFIALVVGYPPRPEVRRLAYSDVG